MRLLRKRLWSQLLQPGLTRLQSLSTCTSLHAATCALCSPHASSSSHTPEWQAHLKRMLLVLLLLHQVRGWVEPFASELCQVVRTASIRLSLHEKLLPAVDAEPGAWCCSAACSWHGARSILTTPGLRSHLEYGSCSTESIAQLLLGCRLYESSTSMTAGCSHVL